MVQFVMENWKVILDSLSHLVFGLVAVATVVVRITPTKSDDEKLDKILTKVHKIFSYLPTLGINPKTKELEEMMKK